MSEKNEVTLEEIFHISRNDNEISKYNKTSRILRHNTIMNLEGKWKTGRQWNTMNWEYEMDMKRTNRNWDK